MFDRIENARQLGFRNKKHGKHGTRIYETWHQMKKRCLNKNDKDYKNYGGRGIDICERWLSFENFYADMGDKPDGMSIDRIDNNKGYSPENCRWTTISEQQDNRRGTIYLTLNGRSQSLTKWTRELGTYRQKLYNRYAVLKWNDYDILTKP